MFSRIANRKRIILSTLLMVLLICGVQGVSYASNLSFVGQPTVTPSSVPGGETFTLSFIVQSQSSAGTPDTTANVVTLAAYRPGSRTNVGITIIEALATGQSKSGSITVTAPPVTSTTRYDYEVRILSSTPVWSDTVTTDNTSLRVPVTVTAGTANLSISPTLTVSPSYSVIPGGSITLTAYVSNTGGAASPSTTFNVYRSNTGAATDPGIFVSPFTVNISANANQQRVSSQVRVLTSPGFYYYRVQIDTDPNKTSNYTGVTVINPVDLSVGTPTVDKSTVTPGETFTLSTTVSNIGAGSFTDTTRLQYFRSEDTTISATDGTDTQVGTDTIITLSGDPGTTTENITVTAPSQPGTYYYFAYVVPVQGEDYYSGRIANNTSPSVTVTVSAPPDLTVSLFRLRQATFAPGEQFTLEAIVRNEGTGGAAATQLLVYQDSDDRYGREQLITRHAVRAISAGNSSAESISLTAPSDAGTYYYRVSVQAVTGETVTDNNASNWVSIDVLEPLVLASLQSSKIALASGESFTLTATIKNDGDARSAGTTVRYYRSSNNSLSSSDTRVGSRTVSALAVGGTTQVSIPLSAPQAPGTYYYGACVGDSQTYSGDACAIIKLTVLAVILPASERPPMYWIDGEAGALQSLTGSRVQRLVQSVQNATGIAVDAAGGKIYWIEKINNRSGRIRAANLDGTNVRSVASLTSAPTSIAVDGLNKRLYITNGWGKVQRLDVDGKNFRSDLITGLSSPRGIAVDAAGGRIYWTEQTSRTTSKLQSADLNGANVRVVLREFAGMPNGIAVDSASGKLYMANVQGQVQRLNLDGSGFQSNFIPNLVSPQSVAVDAAASKIYWTEAGSIRRANLDGTNRQNVVTGLGTPASLSIRSAPVEVLIPQSQRPPIYLQTGTGGLQRLTGATVSSFPQAAQNATGLAVDAAAGKIYWIEKINNRSGRIRSANLDGTNVRLVASLTSAPTGIAVDVSNKRLYITNGWGKVQRLDVDGGNFRNDMITGLSSPRGIAVDAAGGRIYWTEQTSETTGKLQSANLNGGNVRLVALLTSAPMGIAVDVSNKRLYITNGWGKVQRLDVDGRNFRSDLITGLSAPQGIAVDAAAGRIYWTARGKIQRANLDGRNVQDVVRGLSGPVGIALNVSVGRNAAAAPSAAAMAPNATALHANYPNPFNPETWIPYQLREAADVHISIYDQRGVLVRQLSLGHQVAGQYLSRSRAAYWDGRNQVGEPVASGLYFYTLTAGEFTATRKMLIVK